MSYFFSYKLFLQKLYHARAVPVLLCMALLWSLPGRAQTDDDAETTGTVVEAPVAAEEEEVMIGSHRQPEPVVFRRVPDSIVRKIQQDKAFAYANDPSYWKTNAPEEQRKGFWDYMYDLFRSGTVRTIVYSLLIAFFLFVIYRIIVVNKLFLFYSSKKIKKEEGLPIDIEDVNLDDKIQKAVDEKDYRMAVRFMYLKTLQLLNNRQWIQFHAEATNYEYVNQMSGHKLANEFRFLTRVYDYMWYGEFNLTREQFQIVYNNFRHFYNAVNS